MKRSQNPGSSGGFIGGTDGAGERLALDLDVSIWVKVGAYDAVSGGYSGHQVEDLTAGGFNVPLNDASTGPVLNFFVASGATSDQPLFEVNSNKAVPLNTIVRAHRDYLDPDYGQDWRFSYFDVTNIVFITDINWFFTVNQTWTFIANVTFTYTGPINSLELYAIPVEFCGLMYWCIDREPDLAGSVNNYAPHSYKPTYYFSSNSVNSTLTGWLAPQNFPTTQPLVSDGLLFILMNDTAGKNLTIKHESGSSTAANRFDTWTQADIVLTYGQAVLCQYDFTKLRYRVLWGGPGTSGTDVDWDYQTFNDADYTVVQTTPPTVLIVAQIGVLTSNRTATLPAPTTAGQVVHLLDMNGGVNNGTNKILTATASGTINGAASGPSITAAYGRLTFVADGISNWECVVPFDFGQTNMTGNYTITGTPADVGHGFQINIPSAGIYEIILSVAAILAQTGTGDVIKAYLYDGSATVPNSFLQMCQTQVVSLSITDVACKAFLYFATGAATLKLYAFTTAMAPTGLVYGGNGTSDPTTNATWKRLQ